MSRSDEALRFAWPKLSSWLMCGRLDVSTIFKESGLIDHDLLIPEILRREAERRLEAAAQQEGSH